MRSDKVLRLSSVRFLSFSLALGAVMSLPFVPVTDDDDANSGVSEGDSQEELNSADDSDNEMDLADPFIATGDPDEDVEAEDDDDADEEDSYSDSSEGDHDSDEDYVPPEELESELEDAKREIVALRTTLKSYEHHIKKLQKLVQEYEKKK